MKAAATVLIVAFLIVLTFQGQIRQRIDENNAHQAYLEQVERDRLRFDESRRQRMETASEPVEMVHIYVVEFLLLMSLSLGGILLYQFLGSRIKRETLIWADENGNWPLPRHALEQGTVRDLIVEISREVIEARKIEAIHGPGQVPAHLTHNPTYSPRVAVTKHNEGPSGDDDGLSVLGDNLPADIPPFDVLWRNGTIGPDKPLVLGVTASGEVITGDWPDICASAIGGVVHSGKTTTATGLAAQVAIHQGKLVVCDPHGNAPKSAREDTLYYRLSPLERFFACEAAISREDILRAVTMAQTELRQRIQGAPSDIPWLIILDEFSTLMRGEDELSATISRLLEDVATEGRKFKVACALLGQQWHVKRAGGGELKSVLATAYIHRMLRPIARMIVPIGPSMPETAFLSPGEAILYRSGGIERIWTPNITHDTLKQIAVGFANTPGGTNSVLNAEDAEIITLFRGGLSIPDIIRQKWSLTGGGAYQEKSRFVTDVIRKNYRG